MTALEIMAEAYRRKGEGLGHFAHTRTLCDVPATQHTCTPQGWLSQEYTIPANTPVLVTMFSRFGDFGIRDVRVSEITHGYSARVRIGSLDPETWKWLPTGIANPTQ